MTDPECIKCGESVYDVICRDCDTQGKYIQSVLDSNGAFLSGTLGWLRQRVQDKKIELERKARKKSDQP